MTSNRNKKKKHGTASKKNAEKRNPFINKTKKAVLLGVWPREYE